MKRWLLVLAASCGGPQQGATPPPGPDATPRLAFDEDDARRFAAGFVDVLEAMALAVEARAEIGDCPGMAADLAAIFDVSAPLFELGARVQADDAAAKLAVVAMNARAPEAAALRDRISAGLPACAGDPAVIEVIERMPVLPGADVSLTVPPALKDDLPALAARSAELLEALGEALAAQADCTTLAAAARAVLAEFEDVRVAQEAVADRGAGRDLDRELAPFAERVTAAASRMRPAIKACRGDAEFAAALTPVDL